MKYFVFYKLKEVNVFALAGISKENPLILHELNDKTELELFLKTLSEQQADIVKIIKGNPVGFKITTDLNIEE